MRLMYGNMWDEFGSVDLFMITTNSYVEQSGELVMGRGIAGQAKHDFPQIAKDFGSMVLKECGHLGKYGVLIHPEWPHVHIGAFQVKYSFSTKASLDLIQYSVNELISYLDPSVMVALNFPGIGNGGLKRSKVLPIINKLPNNVYVWQYGSQDGDP